jgi:16S rRNA (uracil1498-N3)-methyltransferase
VGKKTLEVLPKQEKPIPEEPEKSISLFMASVSESAWDMVLQKTTELGVKKIHLFSSQNSPKKMSLEDFQKKLRRWEKILWEAAKQSGRGKIPDLVFLKDLDEVLEKTKDLDVVYLCDASGIGLEPITYPPAGGLKPAGLFVGPEGGFTEAEIDKIKKLKNCQLLKLSNFTLRAETAAIAGVAKILF